MTNEEARKAFLQRLDHQRSEMGGTDRIARIHAKGRLTARERFERLLDLGSFMEVGTFARSDRLERANTTPGDGKITGLGTIDSRPVSVASDDVTVLHGSSSEVAGRRLERAYEIAFDHGHPFIYFGETGGARLPETLGSVGLTRFSGEQGRYAARLRQIPMVSAIVGESFGGSSFCAAYSDFVVQARGTCMAVTSPRVIEIATGERVSFEDLGGPAVHARITGQVDAVAEDDDDVIRIIIDFLSYLPSNAWSAPPRTEAPPDAGPDPELLQIVPSKRTRGYDIRSVIRRLVDGRKLLELKPEFGRSLTTCLARMNGETVGILATNPMFLAGALDQNACRKATLFICLCDAFNIPLLFLQDTPGFIVGKLQEHDGLLPSVINFQQAMFLAEVPRVTVMLRKSFGVAWLNMGGLNRGNALTFAWPSAEISFMDPEVGVNVLYADRLKDAPDAEEQRAQLMAELSRDTDPYGAAGAMQLDDIIDPYETRSVITRAFDRLRTPPRPRGHPRPLASWPSAY